jgi:hypothetical protein
MSKTRRTHQASSPILTITTHKLRSKVPIRYAGDAITTNTTHPR